MTAAEIALCIFALGCRLGGEPRLPPVRLSGVATVMAEGDGRGGGTALGCVRQARKWGLKNAKDGMPIVAVRNGMGVACGQVVVIEYRGKTTHAVRLSSGPYGQDCARGRVVAGELGAGCTWRGIVDLTPAVARAIGLPGKGAVRLRWWP